MKRRLPNYRVDVDGTSLQPTCANVEEARRSAQQISGQLHTSATIIQLLPEYAVLDTYRDGVKVEEAS